MPRSFRFVIVAGLFVAAVAVFAIQEYRRAKFLRELCLVGYSTHLIGTPYPDDERAARERAEQLGIDPYAAPAQHPATGATIEQIVAAMVFVWLKPPRREVP